MQIDQTALGMLSREYYLDENESTYKQAYQKYMIAIAELLGANHTHAVKEMNEVLEFEVKLANVGIPVLVLKHEETLGISKI